MTKMKHAFQAKQSPVTNVVRRGAFDYSSRRAFLKNIGLGISFAPFVPLLEAQAQTGIAPQRLVVVTAHNGVGDVAQFHPVGTEANFELGSTLASLNPFKKDLIVFRDFEGRYTQEVVGVHPMASANLLTASPASRPDRGTAAEKRETTRATSISVDQFIAKNIGASTPHESLVLGCGSEPFSAGDDLGGSVSYSGPLEPIVAEADVFKTFDRLFGTPASAIGGQASTGVRTSDQRSILDLVSKNLGRLKTTVGVEDARRLDAHLESVRELEKRLPKIGEDGNTPAARDSCASPSLPPRGNTPIFNTKLAGRFMPDILKAQVDMIVAAFTCDLTRVALLQVGVTTALWPPAFMGMNATVHDLSHNDPISMTKFTARTLQDSYGYLLSRLTAATENGAPLLRQTAAIWMNDFSDGALHQAAPLPIIAAGQAGGKWKTGRFIQFKEKRRHGDFLLTLVQTFGIKVEKFGTDPSAGPLPELLG